MGLKVNLSDDLKQKIVELFHKGYGSSSIALHLKCKSNHVAITLREFGLKRERSEAIKLRKKLEDNARVGHYSKYK